jgi:hypothetical protein
MTKVSAGWKKGDVVKVTQYHNSVPAGTYIVSRGGTKAPGYNISIFQRGSSGPTWNVYTDYCIEGEITLKDFEKRVEELESEIRVCQAKVKWMKQNGVKEYDEQQFKIWTTMQIVKEDTMQIVKEEKDEIKAAKLIAELFKA